MLSKATRWPSATDPSGGWDSVGYSCEEGSTRYLLAKRETTGGTLDEISKLMRDNSTLSLRVVGHTDSTGAQAHNQDLSNRRAASVMRALTQTGIDAKRFTARGAGASEPAAPNETEEGRAKNRRVELVRQ
ncbi:MAG: OmpA family protein [Burkholderiaceae bacterium]|nr:OmpA family protein [Burkholderiaceae bacterium]